jgi:glycosyltransferase involved in cell wall biosynthesis
VTPYRISFFCGRSQEPWSPRSVATGIGGSQEALIAMAAALRQLGHDVRVYNSCGPAAGEHQGVVYQDYRAFDRSAPNPAPDLIIVWRWPWLADLVPPDVPSYLWLHDMLDPSLVAAAAGRYRKIIVLSRFHRARYSMVPEDKVFYSHNGIHLEHFDQPLDRDPYKVVYGSSYDRGLLQLLKIWPDVRAAVPQASLSVFYGFESLRARCFQLIRPSWKRYRGQNPVSYWRLRRATLAALQCAGARHLGRLGHLEVARQFLSAGIWAYPTAFLESHCITAMKAQAGGAFPVVIPSGALSESLEFGARTSTSAQDYADRKLPASVYEEFKDLLIANLRDSANLEPVRAAMASQARQSFSWETVACEWNTEFTRSLSGDQ